MATAIALLRGINVGKAKRVAMAELREVIEGLGYDNVRTLLNSGNAVFQTSKRIGSGGAAEIREALAKRTGVRAEVKVLTAAEMGRIVEENPFSDRIENPSRFLVAFPSTNADLAKISILEQADHAPERFAVGSHAAYLGCAPGILESILLEKFSRLIGTAVTTRNWSTVLKIHAMCSADRT